MVTPADLFKQYNEILTNIRANKNTNTTGIQISITEINSKVDNITSELINVLKN